MCSLCGILGGRGHWADSSASPEAFAARTERHTRRRERQERTRLVNRVLAHYGLSLQDWQGSAYVLKSRTGRSVMVEDLNRVWAEAERLSRKDCDPLDEGLLQALGSG